LRPDNVNDEYPLCGAFSLDADAAALSKEKMGRPVPAKAATVTLKLPNTSAKELDWHAKEVAERQDDVKQAPRSPPPPRSKAAVEV
jgi:hypothetical protein